MAEDAASGPPSVPDRMVILDPSQAELIVDLLNRLQLLLRFGDLGVEQLRLLVEGESAHDPHREEVDSMVGEALQPLRSQLGDA
ncbi:MAG TPA: hypothetical protein VHE80_06280 [Acidimicrobiales bacterium]|nr:hypothetical protein [Acidimicrobiales bacterium]